MLSTPSRQHKGKPVFKTTDVMLGRVSIACDQPRLSQLPPEPSFEEHKQETEAAPGNLDTCRNVETGRAMITENENPQKRGGKAQSIIDNNRNCQLKQDLALRKSDVP